MLLFLMMLRIVQMNSKNERTKEFQLKWILCKEKERCFFCYSNRHAWKVRTIMYLTFLLFFCFGQILFYDFSCFLFWFHHVTCFCCCWFFRLLLFLFFLFYSSSRANNNLLVGDYKQAQKSTKKSSNMLQQHKMWVKYIIQHWQQQTNRQTDEQKTKEL